MRVTVNGVSIWTNHQHIPVSDFDALSDAEVAETVRRLSSVAQAANDHEEKWYAGNPALYSSWLHSSSIEGTEEEFWTRLEQEDKHLSERDAAKRAKKHHIKARRSKYSSKRSDLFLLLLASGHAHRCNECHAVEDLTIDHIKPLSKGGTDDISNLRFLCRPCNSKKGDQSPP